MGAQLDRLRYGTSSPPDPFRAQSEAEDRMIQEATLLRCISTFGARQELRTNASTPYRTLEKIQRAASTNTPQGLIAIEILRSYQEWSTKSQERGLTAIYQYLTRVAPSIVPALPSSTDDDLVTLFRKGKAKRARDFAAEAYADALLSLGGFLHTYNRTKL